MNKKKKMDTSEPQSPSDARPVREQSTQVVMAAAGTNGHDANQLIVPAVAPYPRHPFQPRGMPPTLHGLRRRWPQIICTGLVCAAAMACAAWVYYQPMFRAYATLRVHSETPRLAFEVKETEQAAVFEVYKRTQRELVLGDDVLLAALMDKKIADSPVIKTISQTEDPVTWLSKQLRVEFPGNAEIMSVSMEGDSSSFITDAVNAVLDAYLENVVNAGKQHRSDRLAELRKVLSVQEEKARRLRSKLQSLTESLGSGDTGALGVKQQAAIQRFAQLQTQHGQVQFDRLRTELKLARVADQLKLPDQAASGANQKQAGATAHVQPAASSARTDQPPVPNMSPEQLEMLVQKDGTVARQQEIVQQAVAALEREKSIVKEGQDALLEPYTSRVAYEQQILTNLKESVREELRSQSANEQALAAYNRRADSMRQYDELQGDLKTLQVQEKLLSDKLAEATASADNIGTNSVNVELTRKELERLELINGRISDEIETLTIELSSASRVETLSRAREPKTRSQQDRTKKAVSFAVLGFLLPCAGLLWLDARRKLISGESEIQQLPLRLLGSVPIVRRLNHRKQRSQRDALALREAVDRIRTVLLREADVSDYRVVQITSSVAGEGKTTVACQLANSLARAQRRTVLVDFDLRRPAVHEVFGMPLEKGICDLLRGQTTVDKVLRATDHKDLSVIPAGRCDRSALEGLTNDVVEEVIASLREQFEFVIVDSSPVLPVVDALLVAQQCDATILTALRDISRTPQLLEAEDRLRQIGVNVVGSVVTTKGDHWYGQHLDRYAVVHANDSP